MCFIRTCEIDGEGFVVGFWSIILMTIGEIGASKRLDGKVFSGFCNTIISSNGKK
jgi:hypothetical protein